MDNYHKVAIDKTVTKQSLDINIIFDTKYQIKKEKKRKIKKEVIISKKGRLRKEKN